MYSTVYKRIENYLLEIIAQNANVPDYKLPSERTLSITFNASRKPIRHAYANLIEKGYVINIHGKGYFISDRVTQESPSSIGMDHPKISLVIPSIQSQFSHDILAGASDFCSSHQMELSIQLSDASTEKEAYLVRSLPLSGVKGIILFPVDNDNFYHTELLKLSLRKYPLVLVDRMLPNIHASFISSENHQAMVNAVDFLKKKNFKNLVYMTPPSSIDSTTDARINGFTHGLLRSYEVATPKNLLIVDGSPRQQQKTVVRYLQEHTDTEVMIVGCSQRFPVLMAIQELNIRIPEDMKLMFFDDELSPVERNTLKPYILQQDGYQIGYLAAESLYNQLYGDLRTVVKMLPVTIIDTSNNED